MTTDKVELAHWGLVGCIVCASKDVPKEEVERRTNSLPGCHSSAGWTAQEVFPGADAVASPGQCEDDPDCWHWYMTC